MATNVTKTKAQITCLIYYPDSLDHHKVFIIPPTQPTYTSRGDFYCKDAGLYLSQLLTHNWPFSPEILTLSDLGRLFATTE